MQDRALGSRNLSANFDIFSWQLKSGVQIVILQWGVYGPIVGFHDLFDDGQTDSGTPMLTGMGFFTPIKTLKYIRIDYPFKRMLCLTLSNSFTGGLRITSP